MASPRFTVISTGINVPAGVRLACIESVRRQFPPPIGPTFDHVYLDAAEQPGVPDEGSVLVGYAPEHCRLRAKAHFENLVEVISQLPDDRIVASLDADDWLGPPNALATVARYFAAGAWVTYGSFRFADGRRGCPSEPYLPGEDVRRSRWKATHLKCFRAGLFKRIDLAHLKLPSGEWLPHARDLALMFPLLEMAGSHRVSHVTEEVYVYNLALSTEFTGDAATLAAERECVRYVRGLPPYEMLP